jgi:hypothetical protein
MHDPLDEAIAVLVQHRDPLHLDPHEHRHVCGVPTCGNYYVCHGARCAGTVWLCPACDLDQRDAHADQGGAR